MSHMNEVEILLVEDNPNDVELWLCGEISPSSPLAETISAYFSNIRYDAVTNNGDADARRLSSMLFPLFQ